MKFRRFFEQLNILAQCRRYNISLWQCPQFLFLVMGIFIIGSILITYTLSSHYIENPTIVALIVLFSVIILFIIAFIITHSFEKLLEVIRMKTEFINIASHQLRSPLTNLKWTIDLLLSGRANHPQEEFLGYLNILQENTLRMKKIVNDLLVVSKLESATFFLKKSQFSLKDLITEVIKEFKIFAQNLNVKISFLSPEDPVMIFNDPDYIRWVIENLLDNAIRYIKEKGEVTIRLEKRPNSVYLEIQDTGVGIPKEEQKYIFQKFFRAENILRYQTQGSGLGLYIAKSIIEKAGGKIGFHSQENKGSTFWFKLPISE
jgi:signal transduction histidine kinase